MFEVFKFDRFECEADLTIFSSDVILVQIKYVLRYI